MLNNLPLWARARQNKWRPRWVRYSCKGRGWKGDREMGGRGRFSGAVMRSWVEHSDAGAPIPRRRLPAYWVYSITLVRVDVDGRRAAAGAAAAVSVVRKQLKVKWDLGATGGGRPRAAAAPAWWPIITGIVSQVYTNALQDVIYKCQSRFHISAHVSKLFIYANDWLSCFYSHE